MNRLKFSLSKNNHFPRVLLLVHFLATSLRCKCVKNIRTCAEYNTYNNFPHFFLKFITKVQRSRHFVCTLYSQNIYDTLKAQACTPYLNVIHI